MPHIPPKGLMQNESSYSPNTRGKIWNTMQRNINTIMSTKDKFKARMLTGPMFLQVKGNISQFQMSRAVDLICKQTTNKVSPLLAESELPNPSFNEGVVQNKCRKHLNNFIMTTTRDVLKLKNKSNNPEKAKKTSNGSTALILSQEQKNSLRSLAEQFYMSSPRTDSASKAPNIANRHIGTPLASELEDIAEDAYGDRDQIERDVDKEEDPRQALNFDQAEEEEEEDSQRVDQLHGSTGGKKNRRARKVTSYTAMLSNCTSGSSGFSTGPDNYTQYRPRSSKSKAPKTKRASKNKKKTHIAKSALSSASKSGKKSSANKRRVVTSSSSSASEDEDDVALL